MRQEETGLFGRPNGISGYKALRTRYGKRYNNLITLQPEERRWISFRIFNTISMAYCKTALTPGRYQWNNCNLALSHRYYVLSVIKEAGLPL